jgi:hypothetical protein
MDSKDPLSRLSVGKLPAIPIPIITATTAIITAIAIILIPPEM